MAILWIDIANKTIVKNLKNLRSGIYFTEKSNMDTAKPLLICINSVCKYTWENIGRKPIQYRGNSDRQKLILTKLQVLRK